MIETTWLGKRSYASVQQLQESQRKLVLQDINNEKMFILEHEHVITTGKRSVDLTAIPSNIQIVRSNRGGLATYHGPGQLIVYPIIHIKKRGIRIRAWVYTLEQAVINLLRQFNITATRKCSHPGVWVADNKICSVGLHIQHGVSIHGIAVNLQSNLSYFTYIEPCGINSAQICSLHQLYSGPINIKEIGLELAKEIHNCLQKFDVVPRIN